MNDPISDMLVRIKNGYLAHKKTVEIPYSKVKEALATLLASYHYIESFEVAKEARMITVVLRYVADAPAMTDVKRLSKPGLRRYTKVDNLKDIQGGLGYIIVSTPQGLMTHVEARKKNVGGELICKIW